MRIYLFGLVVLSFTGCAIDTPASSESLQASDVTSQTIPTTTGSFVGSYVVPTSVDLASAAIFSVPEVDWTISSGTVTLHYDLPVGLVGGDLPVTFSGPLASGATSAQLTGANGTSACTASGTVVSCNEVFANLGTLPISMTVVEQTATTTSPGRCPAASRSPRSSPRIRSARSASMCPSRPVAMAVVAMAVVAMAGAGPGPGPALRNFSRRGDWRTRALPLAICLRHHSLDACIEALLRFAAERSSVFHLWGHAWELDAHRLWGVLDRVLRVAARRVAPEHRVPNSALVGAAG